MQPIEHTESDNEVFREIQRELVGNRLAPLTPPASLDSLTKVVLPVALALLVGLDLVSLATVADREPFKGLRETDLRITLVLLALLLLLSAGLAAFGRWVIARNSISAWSNENTRIMNRAHEWFFRRIRDDLVTLKPVLDTALERIHAAADRAAKPGTPPLRVNVVTVGSAGRLVRHTTMSQQQTLLTLLTKPALEFVQLQTGRDPRAPEWYAAMDRVIARQALLFEFLGEQVPILREGRRAFVLSFFSLDLLLVPLALALLLRNLFALIWP